MTIINYEAKWLVEPWLRQNGWTERQIFGIITIIIIAIIMINGVIIDSRPVIIVRTFRSLITIFQAINLNERERCINFADF